MLEVVFPIASKGSQTRRQAWLRSQPAGTIVDQLAAQQPLPEKNRDHDLTGDYIGFRECHIRPDWLLIYRVDGEQLMLFLFRTGTHSDLFD